MILNCSSFYALAMAAFCDRGEQASSCTIIIMLARHAKKAMDAATRASPKRAPHLFKLNASSPYHHAQFDPPSAIMHLP
jgi:hypothetical protein